MNHKCKNKQQNTRDGIEKLGYWRYNRGNRLIGQKNGKSIKNLTQNVEEIWDTMKRWNLRIIGIEEGEEIEFKGTENILNIIEEKLFQPKKGHAYENTRGLHYTQ